MKVIRTARADLDVPFPRVQKPLHNSQRDFAGKLIEAQDPERTRISRELYDNLNQQIAAVSISISNIKRHLRETTSELSEELTQLQKKLLQIAESARNVSHELNPEILEHTGPTKFREQMTLPQRAITQRQRQVLHFIVEGRSMKEIGSILNISRRTVEAYKYEMMESLGIKSSAQLICYGLRLEEF